MRLLAILPVKPRAAKANSSSRISYQKLAPWQDNAFWQEGCCLGQQPSVQYANRLGASIDDRVTKAKKMLPVRLMHASARRGLRALAALVLVLFLSLLALASLPALHQAIHPDANNPNHHCAITLLSQGQIDAPVFDAPVCFTFASCDSAPLFCHSVSSAAVELLPPARGPPSTLS